MNGEWGTILSQVVEIAWINLLLSGDNAVVIALACRALAPRERRLGVIFGTCAAAGLRILFTLIIVTLLAVPLLKLVGAAALLWIAVQLLDKGTRNEDVAEAATIWHAVRTIVVADAVMSLDNVIAIAAAANGSTWLIAFGLGLSIPIVMVGATFVIFILDRLPFLVWAGAALLGWIAGELALTDPVLRQVSSQAEKFGPYAGAAGAILVVAAGLLLRRIRRPGRA